MARFGVPGVVDFDTDTGSVRTGAQATGDPLGTGVVDIARRQIGSLNGGSDQDLLSTATRAGGQFVQGYARLIDEGYGELIGRNRARKEAMNASDRLRQEEAAAALDLLNEREQQHRQDLAASNAAQGYRNSIFGGSRSRLNYQDLGSEEKDFLGL